MLQNKFRELKVMSRVSWNMVQSPRRGFVLLDTSFSLILVQYSVGFFWFVCFFVWSNSEKSSSDNYFVHVCKFFTHKNFRTAVCLWQPLSPCWSVAYIWLTFIVQCVFLVISHLYIQVFMAALSIFALFETNVHHPVLY